MALPDGTLVAASAEHRSDLHAAARLGLGAVGVLTELTLRVEPAFLLHAEEGPASFDAVLDRFDLTVDGADHVDLHWLPFTDTVQLKRWSRSPGPLRPRLHQPPKVRFLEMEYPLPRAAAVPVLRALRTLTEGGPWHPSFPVEVRTAPADDVWLSTAYGRDTVYVACHAYPRTHHEAWFTACEELFVAYGGRPHWGKLHTRTVDDLAPAYPRMADLRAVRDAVDPDRLLGGGYVDRVLGP